VPGRHRAGGRPRCHTPFAIEAPLAVAPPPRVVIISPDQWARAGLRAELRERGVDAVGARDVPGALTAGRPDPERGPVRLLVVEQDALGDALAAGMLGRVRQRLGNPPVMLLAHATRATPAGDWAVVLRRPVSIGEIVAAVLRLLPDFETGGPLDS